jgi:hypothetical protein
MCVSSSASACKMRLKINTVHEYDKITMCCAQNAGTYIQSQCHIVEVKGQILRITLPFRNGLGENKSHKYVLTTVRRYITYKTHDKIIRLFLELRGQSIFPFYPCYYFLDSQITGPH